jgi:hypothetical protein
VPVGDIAATAAVTLDAITTRHLGDVPDGTAQPRNAAACGIPLIEAHAQTATGPRMRNSIRHAKPGHRCLLFACLWTGLRPGRNRMVHHRSTLAREKRGSC